MADQCCDVSKIVTAFFLRTCRLPPWPRICNVNAAVECAGLAGINLPDYEVACIPLITGSVAEFYIEPMLPFVGDIDVMYHRSEMLAIPQGHPTPTQLPAEFHNYVIVLEIIDSHLSGYVYLRYLLTQCSNDVKYNYIEYNKGDYLSNKSDMSGLSHVSKIRGPAMFFDNSHTSHSLSIDFVACVRCLVWPTQASDWPNRHRNYGWPDLATLDRVVSNGCDVVRLAHHQCRQDEWMGKHQWRLSFSRTEIVLVNSWSPVQQIIYHMLRYFVKTEELTDCADSSGTGNLSNYHIKTLMLWAIELKARSWWTENFNLVRICVELLKTLSVWLSDTRCRHYFINKCNLLDTSFNAGNVAKILMSLNEDHLSKWLIKNYIGQCAKLCPDYVSRLGLFNDVTSNLNLPNVVSQIVRWRLRSSLYDM